jgi:hypothetical protein
MAPTLATSADIEILGGGKPAAAATEYFDGWYADTVGDQMILLLCRLLS